MRNWDDMQPELFGADGAATLFDASGLARSEDKCGTPDMFAAAAAEAAEATPEERMITRLEGKGYARGDVKFAIAALIVSFGDEIAAGEADSLIREALDNAPCGCWDALNGARCLCAD
jgi:hypothetical protein